MTYNLATAAEAAGLNKTTIWRAIKTGKISANRSALGGWEIEPAELHRVYPPATEKTEKKQPEQNGATAYVAGLQAELKASREVAELLKSQLSETRTDRDHWREVASRLSLPIQMGTSAQPGQQSESKRRWFWGR